MKLCDYGCGKKTFWLFRTDLRQTEDYHNFKTLDEFKKKNWDFYLNQGILFLENNIYDEFVVWRLQPKEKQDDIIFNINGRKFIQKWVNDFNEVFNYPSPNISLFRGGFKIYCDVTKQNPNFFGLKLYLGAGKRTNPQYGGIYNKILVECNKHITSLNHIPFYKTASPEIFYPLNLERINDLCWICNFEQIRQKGQEFFISNISKSKYLKSLKIVHCGNKPEIGKQMCEKYKINNIEFLGHLNREQINKVLNQSKFGIVTSNEEDGSPRIITEILMSGTPLLIRDKTSLLDFYKELNVVEFNDNNLEEKIEQAMNINLIVDRDRINLDSVCKMNLKLWEV